jgi:hypothetical protein
MLVKGSDNIHKIVGFGYRTTGIATTPYRAGSYVRMWSMDIIETTTKKAYASCNEVVMLPPLHTDSHNL